MRIIEDILYLEWAELVEAGISNNTIKRACSQGYKTWLFIKDPEDGRKKLAAYEVLSDKYKQQIENRYGNPYDYVAKEPIKALVTYDYEAERYFLEYTYGDNKVLSKEIVNKYTKKVNWLNMITKCLSDKRALKKKMGLTIDQFYMHVTDLITTEKVGLPTSYRALRERINKFNTDKYDSVMSPHIGNKNTKKVSSELAESTLLSLLAHPNQYDDVFVCNHYNDWAKAQGIKTITSQTVGNYRRDNADMLTLEREGVAAFKDNRSMKIRGFRPTKPLYLLENDDNVLDLYFRDFEGNDFRKYTAMVVIDSYNNYVLGYAYALNITTGLVQAAYLNALYHIKGLTGEWYLPHETKSDRWATKKLIPFYEKLGKRLEARLGNKNRGYIEPFFGTNHWKNCMKSGAINYSGNNITASSRGVNAEKLAENKKLRPFIGDDANKQIEDFFYNLRHQKMANGMSKQEEWLQAWDKMEEKDKRPMSHEQYLMHFGIEHNTHGKGVKITTQGIDFTRNNIDYSYQLDEYRSDLLGKSVSVFFDPQDLSRVLITDHDKIRLMASSTVFMPRATADYDVDATKYLHALLESQKDHTQKTLNQIDKRNKTLYDNRVNAEALIQAGVLEKGQRRIAEQTMHELPMKQKIIPKNTGGSILDQI